MHKNQNYSDFNFLLDYVYVGWTQPLMRPHGSPRVLRSPNWPFSKAEFQQRTLGQWIIIRIHDKLCRGRNPPEVYASLLFAPQRTYAISVSASTKLICCPQFALHPSRMRYVYARTLPKSSSRKEKKIVRNDCKTGGNLKPVVTKKQ